MPGAPALLFLAYLLGVLPWAAIRSARRVEQALGRSGRGPASDRLAIWGSTLVAQGLLLVLAWLAGRGFGVPPPRSSSAPRRSRWRMRCRAGGAVS